MRRQPAAANSITACGLHVVESLLQQNRITQLHIISSGGGGRLQKIRMQAEAAGVPVVPQSRRALDAMVEGELHQGIIGKARLPQADLDSILTTKAAPIVVLDGVTDPRNLGAVMRVVCAFGGAAVIAPARRSAPLNTAAMRAAAVAAAQLPVIRVPNIARALRQIDAAGWQINAAAEDGSETLYHSPPPAATCWVLGDEGSGIRRLVREHCHHIVRIPTIAGEAGCLNVATACAVCLAAGVGSQDKK